MIKEENVFFIKGKVAEVGEDPSTGNITVVAENAVTGEKVHQSGMVVLATGMQPSTATAKPAALNMMKTGLSSMTLTGGMFAAGCANKPADVITCNQNATGMALKAIQTLVKGRRLSMDKKYRVYICEGCGIADALDIEKLKPYLGRGLPSPHPILCSQQGSSCSKKMLPRRVSTASSSARAPPGTL